MVRPRNRRARTGARNQELKFIPLGGVNAANMVDFLALPVVGAIGGSWLLDKKLIAAKDWAGITALAAAAVAKARG